MIPPNVFSETGLGTVCVIALGLVLFLMIATRKDRR